ncbi:MAG TPA: cysteine desulfurase family protein [Candidatus Desulfobacillus denitrificans]|nr:cysteine desulfurase family protein [Candidatus Desulfobacillus denitrificans]
MFAPAYLDHNATTPLDARVLEAMLPFLKERYGNASSRHEYGRAARAAIDTARQQVAAAVGAHPTEVVFTSGGSEANNLFIKGAAACLKPATIAVSAIEHPCVREPALDLKRLGWDVHEIAVDAEGRVAETDFSAALAKSPKLVSVMLANNETGVLQDIPALATQARTAKAWFHTDAVQALGKAAIDFRALNAAGVNALTVSAHKIYGPKGAAALVLDKRIELKPLICGGGQERNLRSGTENVPAIVGFGAACELAVARLEMDAARLDALRGRLEEGLAGVGATVFSRNALRLPNTTFFALAGIDGETLVAQLDRAGFAVASGSACSSVSPEPSRTLLAMGVEAGMAKGALRVSLGRANTEEDVARFLQALGETMRKLKGLAAVAA